MKARLVRIDPLTDSSKTFWFTTAQRYRYLAGQYAELVLPHVDMDNRGDRRWFSFSSSPTEPMLAMTVKFHPNGSSFKRALLALQPGDEVQLTDPLGDFVLPRDESIPLVFVAAGIGITPVRSMVKYMIDRGETRTVQLAYITHTPEGMAFLPLLTSYPGLRLIPIHPQQTSAKLYPTTEEILQLLGAAPVKRIYLSGPQPLIEKTYNELQGLGVARNQLLLDYFPGYVN